jgi:tight adherence protein C
VILVGSVLVVFGMAVALYTWTITRRPTALRLGNIVTSTKKQSSALGETLSRLKQVAVQRLVPPSRLQRLELIYSRAGQPENYSVEKIVALKIIGGLVGGLAGISFFSGNPGVFGVIVLIVGPVGGFVVPEMLISNRADARRDAVRAALPDAIDQLAVTVRAGLSVDGSLVRVSTTLRGPLAEELTRVVQDIQLGLPRVDALRSMADRMDIPELTVFVRALIQADTLGIPVSETLTTQADEMRLKRRQRAEEQAMKLPVKILIPMTLCILPSLLIIVLGPAIVQLMRNL